MKLSTSLRGLPFNVEMSPLWFLSTRLRIYWLHPPVLGYDPHHKKRYLNYIYTAAGWIDGNVLSEFKQKKVRFGFLFSVLWHVNLRGLFNAKDILLQERQGYYSTHSWEDEGVYAFPKVINPKVNVIAWLEFELAYYYIVVQHFSNTSGTLQK